MSLASLNGHTATRARVHVPDWGLWWADVDLAEEEALTGAVTLVLADKTLSGTIVSGGALHGRASYRIVGGRGGWGATLPRKAYANDLGVKVANVIGDAASACGESIESPPSTKLGPHFVRAELPASFVLNQIVPRAWRVDFDGVTRFGARETVTYTGEGVRSNVDLNAGLYELAIEEIDTLLPGVTIDGSAPATDVEYALDGNKLTARVMVSVRKSRRLEAYRQIFDALYPHLRYLGTWEYRVVSQTGERLNLQPVRTATGMPDLANVPVRPGTAGDRATVLPGELVLVCFADGDPSRPQVTSHDAPDAPGWMPLFRELGGPGALGVAYLGSAVVAGPFGGTVTVASTRVKTAL